MESNFFEGSVLSPFNELIAYEYLWTDKKASFKNLASIVSTKNILPSQVLQQQDLFFDNEKLSDIKEFLAKNINDFSVIFKDNIQYPQALSKAKYPIEMFYYRGNLNLLENRAVSIVGARKMSKEGAARAHKLAKLLASKYTIVSGLAEGIDTVALTTAMQENGNVIGVIGTPINKYYPSSNKQLQDNIATNHLLISQVPMYKYAQQSFSSKRFYFPERNITMAALSEATIIVEASDTSGTHTQAKACFDQGKKLIILNSCFENSSISWPKKYLDKGAYRVSSIEEILAILGR